MKWFTGLKLGCSLIRIEARAAEERVLAEVERVSEDGRTNGLLIQMPLPQHFSAHAVLSALNPLKDVEGLHPENAGLLASGAPRFVPTTPLAGMELLTEYKVDLSGKHVVILGRSNVVGKPLAQLMLEQNASVTILHSRSAHIEEHTRRADILAAAVGKPNLITREMLKPDCVVLDFGINVVNDSIVGDVDFEAAREVASLITPVPGGIGPLTNVMLARNLLFGASLQEDRVMGADTIDSTLGDDYDHSA